MSSGIPPQPRRSSLALVDRLFRSAAGDLVAMLTGRFGTATLDLAEDAVQEAMLAALRRWGANGIPANPVGWLYTVARNRLIDRLRHEARHSDLDNTDVVSDERRSVGPAPDRLDLLLVICGGDISISGAVPLALKVVFGFGVKEIAGLLGVRPKAVEVRLYRARAKLRQREVAPPSRRTPSNRERIAVLRALYVVFAEGFSRPLDPSPIAVDLATESISLVEALVARPGWETTDANALLALFYLQGSRLAARRAGEEFTVLADQDRSLWRADWIRSGMARMELAMAGDKLSCYHLELAIAACYVLTVDGSPPPWERIISLYDDLIDRFPSPFAQLNRAIAVGQARGPEVGLAALDDLSTVSAIQSHPFFHSARAAYLEQQHRLTEALSALQSVLSCARGPSEVAFAERKIDALQVAAASNTVP